MTRSDLQLHADLGIDRELVKQAQLYRVDDRDARELLSLNGKPGDFSGVVYPYVDPTTGHRTTCRIRLDHIDSSGGKYRAPFGDNRHLYFPPGAAALLEDVTVPVLVVEAEKSALAVSAAAARTNRRVLVIALGGCWNWRGRIGKTVDAHGARIDEVGPLPDFHRVTLSTRDVVILFDAKPNESVQAARRQFARVLRQWGATVKHGHLPNNDERVNGPDDFLRWHGDAALWTVFDRAVAEEFTRTEKGAILADSLDNIRIALSRLRLAITFDAFRREVLIDGVPADDVAIDRLWVQIDDTFHFRPSKDVLQTVLLTEAHQSSYHPVRTYLDRLTWDGIPRLNEWLIAYAGAPNTDYVRAVGALPLIAAVRRVRQPGAKFDELLVLESAQGTLKSSALRALCANEDWFSDDLPLGVDSKLVIERTSGKWIIEAAELHGNRGREAEQLKAFLSRQVDGPVRLAYGRLPVTVSRQFIIIGTTNTRLGYLKDTTGARRFWPVAVNVFDVEALTRDRDQLWAEAAARETQGESIRLSPELWTAAGDEQEQRRATDPWEEILEPLLEGQGIVDVTCVAVSAIWDALKLEANHRDNRHADRIAAILQRHGFTTKSRMRVDGKPTLCWLKEA